MKRKRPVREGTGVADSTGVATAASNEKAPRIRCSFCGASTDDTPEAAIQSIEHCNNCRIDIQLKGGWTNIGWRIVQAMRAKLGLKPLDGGR